MYQFSIIFKLTKVQLNYDSEKFIIFFMKKKDIIFFYSLVYFRLIMIWKSKISLSLENESQTPLYLSLSHHTHTLGMRIISF